MTNSIKAIIAIVVVAIAAIAAVVMFSKPAAPANTGDLVPAVPADGTIPAPAQNPTTAPANNTTDYGQTPPDLAPEVSGDAGIDADLREIDSQINALDADNAAADNAVQKSNTIE
ncbi:MAG: hypothetical protein MUD10_00710 [Candidatus Pacebacteria bacterium]|nr:hypothetical protein [Candidatus Paceibacterota bacterium]